MAIDVYSDNSLKAVTPEQAAILNDHGFYQTA
jgi:hypothetical protein